MARTVSELLGMRSEEDAEEFRRLCAVSDQEDLQEAWNELQAVPSYVARPLSEADDAFMKPLQEA